jgi:hypothetical protein
MRPSNNFEDITEVEFNKREQNKKQYQNELFAQMAEARNRRETEKQRKFEQDVVEEQKIKEQLRQIGEEFNRKDGRPKDSQDAISVGSKVRSEANYKMFDNRSSHSAMPAKQQPRERERDRSNSKEKYEQFERPVGFISDVNYENVFNE